MNLKSFSDIYIDENQFNREKMQYFFDKYTDSGDQIHLRNLYIQLRNLQFKSDFIFTQEIIDLTAICNQLTVACDILTSPVGISFIFCGDEPCYAYGNEKLISKALLNLLSNAYLYGTENLIIINTVSSGDFSRIEVLNGGSLPNEFQEKNGLRFVRKVCNKLNGSFLIEQTLTHTKAIMSFKATKKPPEEDFYVDYLSFFNDRLSPVCIEFFGMEHH
ncbi:MAG: HAMP domain-containing histidine kinase [Clostridia bacterium]|nr:HAMP domain-containing histidine kinase [Clostridia bacterium]